MIVLKGRVIDGTGAEPIEKGIVAIEDDKIIVVCAEGEFSAPEDAEILEVEDGTILPGFIDCHCHLASIGMDTMKTYTRHNYTELIEAVADAGKMLDAGFTSARDMGLFGPYLKDAIARGIIPGPRLTVSSRLLSITSGHGDMYPFPLDYGESQNTVAYLVDGPEACYRGVRMMFREGADFIKICSTGGVMSTGDVCEDSEFSPEELRVIVEEAKRHHTYVASHAHGTRGIKDALKAGVMSIEHGMFLDEECVDLMSKMDATLVPTLSILKLICAHPEEVPPEAYQKGLQGIESHTNSVKMAYEAGIRLALGSDFLGGDSALTAFGKQGLEFVSLAEAGVMPMDAIIAGTRNGSHLMKMADRIGTLEKGKLADVVLVAGNPLEAIEVLAEPRNIKIVIQGGRLKKDARA